MGSKGEIIEIVISQLDWYVINQAKKLRKDQGISQADLSVKMGFSEKLVGSIENPTLRKRYNLSHLNLLAKALNCNIQELIPLHPFEHDLVKLKIRRTFVINKNGKTSKKTTLAIIEEKALKNRTLF